MMKAAAGIVCALASLLAEHAGAQTIPAATEASV
jgi:hypothetical protein